MEQPAPRRRFGLDVMRATAIACVLVAHMANGFEWLGFYGVEIFFVLSGFLIGSILLRTIARTGRLKIGEFLKRRWFRTLPNYYLFLAMFFTIQLVHPMDGTATTADLPRYMVFLQNFAWPRPSFFGVSWSLCVEEWFYLLLAGSLATLMPLLRRTAGNAPAAMLIIGTTFVILPLGLRLISPTEWPVEAQRMVVVYRLDAIMYGVIMAALKARGGRIWDAKRRAAVLGIAVIVVAHAAADPTDRTHFSLLLSAIPLGFSLLLPFFDALNPLAGWCGMVVERVSVWSYSMYLCHIPIYLGLKPVVGYDCLSNVEKLIYKIFSLILIVGVSALIYRYFERPITSLRDGAGRAE